MAQSYVEKYLLQNVKLWMNVLPDIEFLFPFLSGAYW